MHYTKQQCERRGGGINIIIPKVSKKYLLLMKAMTGVSHGRKLIVPEQAKHILIQTYSYL